MRKQRHIALTGFLDFDSPEFLAFAKAHLSEDFPNPDRIGCPPDADLVLMAEHPLAKRDEGISLHICRCSPCFRRYMEILSGLKRRLRGARRNPTRYAWWARMFVQQSARQAVGWVAAVLFVASVIFGCWRINDPNFDSETTQASFTKSTGTTQDGSASASAPASAQALTSVQGAPSVQPPAQQRPAPAQQAVNASSAPTANQSLGAKNIGASSTQTASTTTPGQNEGKQKLNTIGKWKAGILLFWIFFPPFWLWVEYFGLYLDDDPAGEWEKFKYAQDVTAKLWIAVASVLTILYFGKDLKH